MNIATFEANCTQPTCGHKFDAPLLSDFSYGEYIYSSNDGMEIKYFCGLKSEAWKLIGEIISEADEKDKTLKIGPTIQRLIGLVADRKNPDSYFTQDIYCPKCRSKVFTIDSDKKTGINDYLTLTFENFMNLPELKRKYLIESLIMEQ
ncbi:hypothetical protein Q4603_08950 [Zobellia galactanivorans]|uniref:hypothetical protein n=1 Tax=Zobellia galactanivorans (strain DSM 12802 / CCUG 47099 / CIP 106680 / NCIMB 13871 / Dsij) TaxID=63186 RepID=UPI0026E236D6|nr:hypothetical protein [Zobellia galactanivorans]MDO6808737.1 hypothetical protein [Zobellia galactanivorans]